MADLVRSASNWAAEIILLNSRAVVSLRKYTPFVRRHGYR